VLLLRLRLLRAAAMGTGCNDARLPVVALLLPEPLQSSPPASALAPSLPHRAPTFSARPAALLFLPPQASFFHRAVGIAASHKAAQEAAGRRKVAEFRASLSDEAYATWPAELVALKAEIATFARSSPVVGFDAAAMRYKA